MIYSLRFGPALGPSRPNAYLGSVSGGLCYEISVPDKRLSSEVIYRVSQNNSIA